MATRSSSTGGWLVASVCVCVTRAGAKAAGQQGASCVRDSTHIRVCSSSSWHKRTALPVTSCLILLRLVPTWPPSLLPSLPPGLALMPRLRTVSLSPMRCMPLTSSSAAVRGKRGGARQQQWTSSSSSSSRGTRESGGCFPGRSSRRSRVREQQLPGAGVAWHMNMHWDID